MLKLTGQVVESKFQTFGEGPKVRLVWMGVIGDTDDFNRFECSGSAPEDLLVGESVAMRITKVETTKWGARFRGVVTREKQGK